MMPPNYWITVLITAAVVVACVVIHYEGLRLLSDILPSPKHHHRRRIVFLMLFLLLMHVVEVWLFGLTYFALLSIGDFGDLVGISSHLLFDSVYFSASAYTTIGFGDIIPTGALRALTGTEGITGLMMITWSASYTFVEMSKHWRHDD